MRTAPSGRHPVVANDPSAVGRGLLSIAEDDLFVRQRVRFAVRRLECGSPPVAGEPGHGDRVAELAARVAWRLGMDDLAEVSHAGFLHDIGKAALPFDPTVLPRPLTHEERAEVERHPQLGATIAAEAGYSDVVVDGVLFHHERIDGSGYPYGLVGTQIPLVAQVVAAVDVYDALSTARCYKDPWCRRAVLRFGMEQRGRSFLPRVWDALVAATA